MQPSQARTRRQRKDSFGDDDDGASSLAREGYRNSPPRDRFDMREDKYSSRRDDDEHGSGRSRTGYSPSKDHLRRRGRDDFERRDTESWASVEDSHYSRPWKDDTGYPTAGRGDGRAEGSWPSNRSDHRDADNSQWTPDNEHSSYREDRNRRRLSTNDRQRDGWGKSDNKRSSNTRDWRRDNGWEGRRRSTVDEHPSQQAPPSTSDNSRQQGEERTWEPAASWKPNNRPGHNQNQGQGQGQTQKRQNNRNKGKKKKHNQQKKDWRAPDDSHLNNWTKREGPSANFKNSRNGVKRHQPRSPSRSPSRSPESFYSHRSSPGRSLSSDAPSRRRRADDRYSSRRSRSPIESGSGLRRYSRSPLPSPRSPWRTPSPNSRGRAPRRNFSSPSVSSRSRSRTRSRSLSGSPRERSRTVHRLPRATSYKDVQVSMSKGSQQRVATLPLRTNAPQKNGKEKHSKHDRKSQPYKGKERATGPKVSSSAMPPPSLPAFASESRPSTSQPPLEPSPPPETQKAKETTPRSISIRPGFKPIGQPSSSLKRFFPSEDDDENEQISRPISTALISKPAFVPASSDKSVVPSGQSKSRGDWRNPLDTRGDARNRRSPVPSASPATVPMAISPPSHRQSTMPGIRTTAPDNTTPPATRPTSPLSASDEVYVIVSQVGEGTFGKVYKARNVITGRFVALKRIRMEAERDGFPVTAMREIKLLQSLRHENVVRLHEMMVANGSVYMVFEYMDHDLTGILSQTQFSFDHSHLKSLCRQMFSGLAYLHQKGVIHRDIKGSNILVNNRGELKLGDFGLARFYQKRRRSDYTNRVITLWYRPPELLFGTTVYGPEVDMWSAGCIMLELFTKKPVFQGNDEIHQLDVIYKLLGTPTTDRWPEVTSLPWYELVKPREVIPNHFAELFQKWIPSQLGLALAERLLAYNPARRATAAQAFDDDYFKESPIPSPPTGLSQLEGEWHELETKRERAKKRRKTEGGSSGPH